MNHPIDRLGMAENDPASKRCGECDCEITIGRDAIRVQEGVIGTKDFIELSDELLFCGEACLRKFYDDTDMIKLDRRVP